MQYRYPRRPSFDCQLHVGWRVFTRVEFTRRSIELAAQYSYVSWRVERYRYSIAGNPPNLENDVISNVNPFTDFPAKDQHL
jgi:hypothetical protein